MGAAKQDMFGLDDPTDGMAAGDAVRLEYAVGSLEPRDGIWRGGALGSHLDERHERVLPGHDRRPQVADVRRRSGAAVPHGEIAEGKFALDLEEAGGAVSRQRHAAFAVDLGPAGQDVGAGDRDPALTVRAADDDLAAAGERGDEVEPAAGIVTAAGSHDLGAVGLREARRRAGGQGQARRDQKPVKDPQA